MHRFAFGSVVAALVAALVSACTASAATPVSVFPVPGASTASLGTQISFRGLPASQLGQITVSGSLSGAHTGRLLAHSDGQGASFLPAKPFKSGELVTVRTGLDLLGGANGAYQFTVARPAGNVPFTRRPAANRVSGDVTRFRSRPDLIPATLKVTRRSRHTAPGDIFVAPQYGPIQDGPMIFDANGGLIWFKPVPSNDWVADFRAQTYAGKPVLTWWQGFVSAGIGVGEDEIFDSSYRPLAVVKAGNGLRADLHEFQLTPQGTALITSYYPVIRDASSVKGSKNAVVLDAVVQEIDIPTGLVLFQWDSLDHVALRDTYIPLPAKGHPFDYFHINSVQQDTDGNLIVSGRNTSAAYKIDHRTGAVIWQLGGKHSTFRMGKGTGFAFQHDVRARSAGIVTLFDDGAGPPQVHKQSRAITLRLDTTHKTATLAGQDLHGPALLANFEGNDQLLPNGDSFVGWGQQPYVTEFDPKGLTLFDAKFLGANPGYRAYRLPWSGSPAAIPALATSTSHGTTTVSVSWNGATSVASWRVLAGSSASALKSVAVARNRGFETAIRIRSGQHFAEVQALDSRGATLSSSHTAAVR
jgi:hypothetical protein